MHKRNIVLLCLITFLQGMVFYAAVATLYRQAAGLSIFEITAIEGISVAMALALEVPWGRIAERIGYRHTMVVCNLLFLLTKLIFWQAESFSAFLLERLLLAVVISGLSGVDAAIGGLAVYCISQRSLPCCSILDCDHLCFGCVTNLLPVRSQVRRTA